MSYHLDHSEQARFGLAEPDDEHHSEEQAEPSDRCPHCHAARRADHTRDCPYFEEEPLPF